MREHFLAMLAVLCIVGDLVLILAGHDVPPLMETVTAATVGGVAGVAIPRRSGGL